MSSIQRAACSAKTGIFIMLTDELKKLISDICTREKPLEADDFFSNIKFVPGKAWIISSGKPIDSNNRLQEYEELLLKIYKWDQKKYFFIHKGTAFFYSGIHAFDLKLYDKAFFYFDTAISEDLKNKAYELENVGGYALICLNKNYENDVVQVPIKRIVSLLETLIEEYNRSLDKKGQTKLNCNNLIEKFVKPKYRNKSYRSIILAFYSFVLESEEKIFQMKVRSDFENSIETFITFLLKGCLIFESLIRQTYSSHSSSNGLSRILEDQYIKKDLGYKFVEKNSKDKQLISYIYGIRKTLPDIINHLLPYVDKNKNLTEVDRWFVITYALRNVSAHTLAWPDVFDINNFEKFYKSIAFSILHLVNKNIEISSSYKD